VEQDCLYNGWCYEADLNYDFTVDFKGSAALASGWLNGQVKSKLFERIPSTPSTILRVNSPRSLRAGKYPGGR
jgi:hypothetical protein